jgi:hypothetical protein
MDKSVHLHVSSGEKSDSVSRPGLMVATALGFGKRWSKGHKC